MTLSLEQLREQKAQILTLAKCYQAEHVRVFGSVVRRENTDKSDVDFLVSFKPGASLFDQIGLAQELSALLKRDVDVVSDRGLSPYLKQAVIHEATVL